MSEELLTQILDQVALEGLDGITLEHLIQRLTISCAEFNNTDENIKQFLFQFLKSKSGLKIYQLKEKREDLIIFDRYDHQSEDGILLEPDNSNQTDPYPFHMVEEQTNYEDHGCYFIRGSCSSFASRKDITENAGKCDRVEDLTSEFGPECQIVFVASQYDRERAILGENHDPFLLEGLTTMQWCILERIGRSRYQGELSFGQNSLRWCKEDSKSLFYHMKHLRKMGLVSKKTHYQRTNQVNVQRSLYYLPRFYVQRISRIQLLITNIVTLLKSSPEFISPVESVLNHIPQIEKISFKKLMKNNLCSKFVTFASVAFRKVYPDATEEEWMQKSKEVKERLVRVVMLKNPDIDPATMWSDDKDMDEYGDVEGKDNDEGDWQGSGILDQSKFVLNRSVMHQAYRIIHEAGPEGIVAAGLWTRLGLSKLDARTILRNMRRRDVVSTVTVEKGRQRNTKFVAKKFEKSSSYTANFHKEKRKLEQYLQTEDVPAKKQKTSENPEDGNGASPIGITSTGDKNRVEVKMTEDEKLRKFGFRKKKDKTLSFQVTAEDTKMSTKALRRANDIIEFVRKHKVIDNPFQISTLINEREAEEGYEEKMDKKSLLRILLKLEHENQIKNVSIELPVGDKKKKLHFVCDPSIDLDHSLVQSALERMKLRFETMGRRVSNDPSELKTESVGRSIREMAEAESLHEVAEFKPSYNRKYSVLYGSVPKFLAMREVHLLLFYLTRYYQGNPDINQDELIQQLSTKPELSVNETVIEELKENRIYSPNADWKMFVSPLPIHSDWGQGWFLICDIILRTPLSVFVQVVAITFEIKGLEEYLNHPIRRHYLVKQLPLKIRSLLFHSRKYVFSFYEKMTKLCFIGATQFGPQKLHEKDQVFVYVNTKVSLTNTSECTPAYNRISQEEVEQFKVKIYELEDLRSVEGYWYDMWDICMKTSLGFFTVGTEVITEKAETKKDLLKSLLPVTSEEATKRDQGTIPGDHLGAAGFDSAIFSHLKRNWYFPKSPMPRDKSSTNVEKQKARTIKGKVVETSLEDASNAKQRLRNQKGAKHASKEHNKVVEEHVVEIRSVGSLKKPPTKHKVNKRVLHKRKIETTRRPYYDDKDKVALGLMTKLRVTWTPLEDSILLLGKVAGAYLTQHTTNKGVSSLLIRDVLHDLCEVSRNKTSRACQRRILYMMKNPETSESTSLFIEEVKQDNWIRKNFPVPQESSKEKNEARISQEFAPLLKFLYNKYNQTRNENSGLIIPSTIEELKAKFEIVLPKTYDGIEDFCDAKDVNDVRGSVVNAIIMSSLCSTSEKTSYAFQLFQIYQQYPDSLLRVELEKLKTNRMVSLKKNFKKRSTSKGSYLPLSSAPYQLSVTFSHKILTRFQYDIFSQSWDMLKLLINNSSKGLGTELMIGEEGGFAATLVELFALDKLFFKTEVPEQLVILDPKLSNVSEQHEKLVQRYKELMKKPGSSNAETVDQSHSLSEKPKKSTIKASKSTKLSKHKGNLEFVKENEIKFAIADSNVDTRSVTSQPQQFKSASRLALYMMREEISETTCHHIQHTHDFFVISSCQICTSFKSPDEETFPVKNEVLMEIMSQFGLDSKGRTNRNVDPLKRICVSRDPITFEKFCSNLKTKTEKSNFKTIYNCILDAKELGQDVETLRNLKLDLRGSKRSREDYLRELMRSDLVIRSGITTSRFIAHKFAFPWLLHSFRFTRVAQRDSAPHLTRTTGKMLDVGNQSKEVQTLRNKLVKTSESEVEDKAEKIDWNSMPELDFLIRPWIKIDGNLNRRVLDRLLGSVLGYAMQKPGLPLSDLAKKLSPAIQPFHSIELVEILQCLGSLTLKRVVKNNRKCSLFSSSSNIVSGLMDATILDDPKEVMVEPAVDAVMRLGQFIGDKQYTVDFACHCPCHPDKPNN